VASVACYGDRASPSQVALRTELRSLSLCMVLAHEKAMPRFRRWSRVNTNFSELRIGEVRILGILRTSQ
jgi:hypothetical protein